MTSSFTTLLKVLRITSGPSVNQDTTYPLKTPNVLPELTITSEKTFTSQTIETMRTVVSGLPEISLQEVAMHDDYDDCWIIIYDRVYDVTKFLYMHPGGEDVIMDHAGRDATLAFHGTGHSRDAIDQMRDYLIGELPPHERIFRTQNGKVLSMDIPE
ncbi:cytochrome b5 [Teleopsis dalmanni]|uniref:cytochrome b5 n=1 Tax=Teleopsis dalmanni TaxID=139649 RepID=UPI0018CF3449|nr:cytochrome b5 [Teleopsis dalmanni]